MTDTSAGSPQVGMEIVARGISKTFVSKAGRETVALAGLDLTARAGTITCIIGPSGCGKTTLLNVIAGFEEPTGGELTCDSKPITGPGSDRVVIFQDVQGSLMPWLTVQRNVEFGMRLGKVTRHARRTQAEQALELVGLGGTGDKYITELSGGMQQRVQIARALSLRPGVLLMDEPFGALDYLTRSQLQGQLQRLHEQSGITVLFVTHDISEAAILGDQIVVMSRGGHLQRVIDVDLPRPRSLTDSRVVEIEKELIRLIVGEGEGEAHSGEPPPPVAAPGASTEGRE
jgi:ABC-type nitrate/sulfonate/bicarbonate transport system ATPase subunit